MPPKKAKAAAATADPDDVSVDAFWKQYRKNCSNLEIPQSPCLKALYTLYEEDSLLP